MREALEAMKSPPLLITAAALFSLAACNSQHKAEVVDTNPDPMANQLANAAPVEMPPAIKADKTMRCKDNSLVYVTFFEGDKMAVVRTAKAGTPTQLKAEKAGDPFIADGGWKMTGSPETVTLTQPGKAALSCKA